MLFKSTSGFAPRGDKHFFWKKFVKIPRKSSAKKMKKKWGGFLFCFWTYILGIVQKDASLKILYLIVLGINVLKIRQIR